jgi:hypothetical protein
MDQRLGCQCDTNVCLLCLIHCRLLDPRKALVGTVRDVARPAVHVSASPSDLLPGAVGQCNVTVWEDECKNSRQFELPHSEAKDMESTSTKDTEHKTKRWWKLATHHWCSNEGDFRRAGSTPRSRQYRCVNYRGRKTTTIHTDLYTSWA